MRRERASLAGSRTITVNSVSDAEGKGSRWIYPLLRRSKKNPPDANEHPADQEWEEYQLIAKRRRSGTWKRSAKRGTTGKELFEKDKEIFRDAEDAVEEYEREEEPEEEKVEVDEGVFEDEEVPEI